VCVYMCQKETKNEGAIRYVCISVCVCVCELRLGMSSCAVRCFVLFCFVQFFIVSDT
jgi:hypothetical protein